MTPNEFRQHAHRVVDWLADYFTDIRQYPVLPAVKPGDVSDGQPADAPAHGEPMERILDDFERQIIPAVTHWNHPRFHSFFAISSSPPGVLAEMLIAGLNMQHMLWKSGPAGTEIEQVTTRWLARWMGMSDDWFAQIFDTASTSTLHGIAAAREQADPQSRQRGAAPHQTVYASEFVHSSVDKACIMLGIGLENLRKIPVDAELRMRPELLARAIAADRAAGKQPICVVPTIGTTGATSIDPLREIVSIARHEGLWVHVDAAYGGVAAILPELRHILDGVEEADSLVVNPHKWLFVPIDLSVFYTRKPEALRRAFSLVPDYLKYEEDPRLVNLMDYGLPLGRRFRSLKLWFVMRHFGREGVVKMIREHIAWSHEMAALIAADERFELAAPVTMGLVCFRLKSSDEANQRLVETINNSGFAFLSQTNFSGRFVIRWAIGTYLTTRADLLQVWERIQETAD
jgi:aromatic-L-amino-acid/L-tryptophan decarboxylase